MNVVGITAVQDDLPWVQQLYGLALTPENGDKYTSACSQYREKKQC